MVKTSKAQVALEFMIMLGLAMIFIMVLAFVIYRLSYDYSEEKHMRQLMDLGYSLQNELVLASEVEPGYQRDLFIPDDVDGFAYSISQVENNLVITYRQSELLFSIPPVSGSFAKGNNTIRKTDANSVTIN